MSSCVFCKIVEGQLPCQKVFESETVLAFKDLHPQHPIHYLFIPKKHYVNVADLPDDNGNIMADLFAAIKTVAEKEGFAEKGYRNVINTGTWGGQTVFHLHVHLLSGRTMSPSF